MTFDAWGPLVFLMVLMLAAARKKESAMRSVCRVKSGEMKFVIVLSKMVDLW